MTRACKSCQWWVEIIGGDGDQLGLGMCKGAPPVPLSNGRQYPVTMDDDWCGQFHAREAGSDVREVKG